MLRSDNYNTKQKDVIIDFIKKKKHEFTIKDIYNDLKGFVGLTTIYRLIDKLVDNGRVSKYIGKDNITYYHYLEECNEENHFYLKCDKCGDMIHVDCECIDDWAGHIFKEHRFKPSKENVIINGLCEKCIDKEEK